MNSPADYAAALLRRAVGDQYVVERLAGDAQAPAWVLGFHAQQAVEKALKAVLCFHVMQFPRTHNLAMLLELLRRASHSTPPDGDDLNRLIAFGVALRYEDGTVGDDLEIDRAWVTQAVRRTVDWARDAIGTAPSTENKD